MTSKFKKYLTRYIKYILLLSKIKVINLCNSKMPKGTMSSICRTKNMKIQKLCIYYYIMRIYTIYIYIYNSTVNQKVDDTLI